jgi:hypothetical protein
MEKFIITAIDSPMTVIKTIESGLNKFGLTIKIEKITEEYIEYSIETLK